MQNSDSLDGLLYANFNPNYKQLMVGTNTNFKIFKLNQDPIIMLHQSGLLEKGNFEIVESVDKFVFTVRSDENNKLQIWNFKEDKVIEELSFSSKILSLRVNSKYIVLCFSEEIHIFFVEPFQFVTKIPIVFNPNGVMSITNQIPYLLAYPSRNDRGEFIVYNIESHEKIKLIFDHGSAISKLQFNHSGDKIASVSVSGRFIKINDLKGKMTPVVLKRGLTKASVSLPMFSKDGKYLVCSSDKTIHVFNIEYDSDQTFIQGMIGYKAIYTIPLSKIGESICGFSEDSTRLYVMTEDGIFSKYSWDNNSKTYKFMSDIDIMEDGKDDEASDAWI